MNELFDNHLALIARRWPQLTDSLVHQEVDSLQAELIEGHESTLLIQGIQLTSRHDRQGEARLQAASIPEASPVVHLYGTGLGELATLLLSRPALRQLRVHILNEALFSLVLRLLAQPWLADPRVELQLAADSKEIVLPFIALPAELMLTSDANAKLRDRLVAQIELPYVNRQYDPAQPHRRERIRSNHALLAQDRDVAELFGSHPGCEALVVATGPTLARHYARLQQIMAQPLRSLLICVDTAYRPLREQGIRPDFIVSTDINIHGGILLPEESDSVGLVYFPMVSPEVLLAWKGPRYGAYSASPLYEEERGLLPRGELFSSGSVLHPAVDLAVKMGASRVTLLGADFAFIGSQTHAGWPAGLLTPANMSQHWVLNGHGQRVTTLLNFRSYLCYLERYITAHPEVQFFNTCREGALIDGADYDPAWLREGSHE